MDDPIKTIEQGEPDEDDFGPCDECGGRGQVPSIWDGTAYETCHVCAGTGQVLRDLAEREVTP